MKALLTGLLGLAMPASVLAGDASLNKYITGIDYAARKEMKIDSKGLIQLLKEGKAQLIDIRFEEEYAACSMSA